MGLKVYAYDLACTERGLSYFSRGGREGLFCLFEHDGEFAVAEFAPLQQIHRHSLLDAVQALRSSKDLLKHIFAADTPDFQGLPEPLPWLMSMAHMHYKAQLQPSLSGHIRLSALVAQKNVYKAIALASEYVAQGFSCLKIKVGHPVQDEIYKIKTIAAICGSGLEIRLDANKAYSLEEAVYLVKALTGVKVSYFEEPLADVTQLKALYEQTGLTIAMDESFATATVMQQLTDLPVKVLVIKPSRFRAIYDAFACVEQAISFGLTPILSHCFESEFSAALYMTKIPQSRHAHGIFAEGFFRENVFHEPLRSFRGLMSLTSCSAALKNNFLSAERFLPVV